MRLITTFILASGLVILGCNGLTPVEPVNTGPIVAISAEGTSGNINVEINWGDGVVDNVCYSPSGTAIDCETGERLGPPASNVVSTLADHPDVKEALDEYFNRN